MDKEWTTGRVRRSTVAEVARSTGGNGSFDKQVTELTARYMSLLSRGSDAANAKSAYVKRLELQNEALKALLKDIL